MKLIEKREVNSGRQIEADIAKAICIIGMIFVHCYEELYGGSTDTSAAEYIIVVVLDCIFGAGTFMFCMGLGIAYSRSAAPEKLIKRGGFIFLAGWILNIIRGVLPTMIAMLSDNSPEMKEMLIYELVNIDILPFAGLALMLFGLLKKHSVSDAGIAGTAAAMSVLGSFVRNFSTGKVLPDQLIGLFFGTNLSMCGEDTCACFPLFNWFIFVVAGYLFAQLLLRRCSDKKKLYAALSPAAGAIVAIYMLAAIPKQLGMMSGDLNLYYHMTTLDAVVCIAAAIAVFGMYFALSTVLPETLKKLALNLSGNINRIYCIHWVLLGWLSTFIDYVIDSDAVTDLFVLATGAVLLVVSALLADYYVKKIKGKNRKGENLQ